MNSRCPATIGAMFVLAGLLLAIAATGCGGAFGDLDTPLVTGCNSVYYRGATFTNLGCAPGIASFDVFTTQGGSSASLHITCAGGCVSSATPLD